MKNEFEALSKKERKKLAQLARQEKELKELSHKRIVTISSIIVIVLVVFGGLMGVVWQLTRPLPGVAVADLGKDHISDIADIAYNSNPPTSGNHFSIWAKPGLYDRVISDGYLIHSLEHGYIVISYNCDKQLSNNPIIQLSNHLIRKVFAHGDEAVTEATESGKPLMHMTATVKLGDSWVTPENPPEKEIELPESFSTDQCKALVEELKPFLKTAKRVIIVPRPQLDNRIALTAWNRIEKMEFVDSEKIKTFIKAFHNRGPEKTME